MPAGASGATDTFGRRSENLQGRKPREAMRGRGSFRYGDLIAAADDGDGGGDEPACWPRAMRAMSKRGSASNDEYWRSV